MCVSTPEIPDREMVSMRRKDRQFGEVSEKTRKNMQKIRSKDTSIEVDTDIGKITRNYRVLLTLQL